MAKAERHPFEARLAGWPDPRLATILAKRVRGMIRYFPAELAMDQAHTVMLHEVGILSREEAAAILRALRDYEAEGIGDIVIDGTRSTLFWYVEARLNKVLGEQVGGKLHTGRSHNDILPTVSRLTARDELLAVIAALDDLRHAVLDVAGEHVETVMPGYTALQHAQPWTFGHYLSAWAYAFERDFRRLRAAYENTNRSSLGASALAGSSWPLDRARTAALLGFDGVIRNSRDAGFGTKDYVAEILAAVTIAMSDLGLLCADLYLWSSWEFGMIELADGFCGTSSQMPQKKNAWAVDWVRGAAGNAIADLTSALGAMKGASSTDGAAQEYPETALAAALDSAKDNLALIAGAIASINVRTEVMAQRAAANWTTANALADAIVRRSGLSFRLAHAVVANLVRSATAAGLGPDGATGAMVDRAATETCGAPVGLSDAEVREALDPLTFVRTRVTAGSVNPTEVRSMIAESTAALEADDVWLAARRAALASARDALTREVDRIVGSAAG